MWPPDRRRVDAVQVLEIVADVREPVLHRLDGRHARQPRHGGRRSPGAARPMPRSFTDDVGAVGELGVDTRLGRVGRVEDRDRDRERRRQRHQHEAARQGPALAGHRGGDDAGEPVGDRRAREAAIHRARGAASPRRSGDRERRADPEQHRREQGEVAHRDRRAPLPARARPGSRCAPPASTAGRPAPRARPRRGTARPERPPGRAGRRRAVRRRTVNARTSRQAGTTMITPARPSPNTIDADRPTRRPAPAWRPKRAVPKRSAPTPAAAASPTTAPDGPDEERLGAARRTIVRGAAPRMRSRACSSRRRSRPVGATTTPASSGRDDHGRQAEEQEEHLRVDRVRPRAVELRGRGCRRRGLRRRARPRGSSRAEDLRERRSRGPPGRSRASSAWTLDRRRPRRRARTAPPIARPGAGRRCRVGRRPEPAGAPIRWKSESAAGRSTTPSTRIRTRRLPGALDRDGRPRPAPRLAAVCCASSTPDVAPDERAYLARERGRVAVRQTEDRAGTGRAASCRRCAT